MRTINIHMISRNWRRNSHPESGMSNCKGGGIVV